MANTRLETSSLLLPASIHEHLCGVSASAQLQTSRHQPYQTEDWEAQIAQEELSSDRTTVSPPYPNPCGEETTVRCVLPEAQMLTLCLYDAFGRQVMTVAEGQHGKGAHVFRLITKALPAGVYHLRLQTPDAVMVQNLVHF